MGLLGKFHDGRKTKVAASMGPLLDPGESVQVSAICQRRSTVLQVWYGNKGDRFLAAATDKSFYCFLIHPIKSEVVANDFAKRDLVALESRMDKGHAVVDDMELHPVATENQLEELVGYLQDHRAPAA